LFSFQGHICPRTWDGLKCFDDTDAGTSVKFSCPGYMKDGNMQGLLSVVSIHLSHAIQIYHIRPEIK
jgi:hypothetical protein